MPRKIRNDDPMRGLSLEPASSSANGIAPGLLGGQPPTVTRTEERKKERKNRKKEGKREFIGVCAAGSALEIEKEGGTGGTSAAEQRK
jgi:hypothetical protein